MHAAFGAMLYRGAAVPVPPCMRSSASGSDPGDLHPHPPCRLHARLTTDWVADRVHALHALRLPPTAIFPPQQTS